MKRIRYTSLFALTLFDAGYDSKVTGSSGSARYELQLLCGPAIGTGMVTGMALTTLQSIFYN
jgi:hypothetical protein